MIVSVRLDPELEKELARAARLDGVSRSELIRRCLTAYFARKKVACLAWELGKDVFGRVGSGRDDRSLTRKQHVRDKIHAGRR